MAKRRRKQRPDQGATYMPTKREIRECCAEIQNTWSHKEEMKRAGVFGRPAWTVPEVHVNDEEIGGEEGSQSDSSAAGGLDSSSDSI